MQDKYNSIETLSQSRRIDQMREEFIQVALRSVNNQTLFIVKWENKDTLKYHIEGNIAYIYQKADGKNS